MVILSSAPSLLTKPIRQLLPKEKSAQEFKKRGGVLQGVGSPFLLAQSGVIHHSKAGYCAVLGGRKV